mmetsp:Transcript_96763/g.260183  ORF Transcript_96763/g.260183 Transcript_96763/m.260183 type:complete len:241 (-) Transcript_96763:77-799(-)
MMPLGEWQPVCTRWAKAAVHGPIINTKHQPHEAWRPNGRVIHEYSVGDPHQALGRHCRVWKQRQLANRTLAPYPGHGLQPWIDEDAPRYQALHAHANRAVPHEGLEQPAVVGISQGPGQQRGRQEGHHPRGGRQYRSRCRRLRCSDLGVRLRRVPNILRLILHRNGGRTDLQMTSSRRQLTKQHLLTEHAGRWLQRVMDPIRRRQRRPRCDAITTSESQRVADPPQSRSSHSRNPVPEVL